MNDVHYIIYINTHTIHRYTGISCQDIHLGIFLPGMFKATFVFSNAPFGFPVTLEPASRDHMDQQMLMCHWVCCFCDTCSVLTEHDSFQSDIFQ